MNTITLLLSLIILVSQSNLTHSDDGFTVDLIHIDSPLSPLHNVTFSPANRLRNAFIRSMYRAFRLFKRSEFVSKIDADVFGIPGVYLMKIKIGTPAVEVIGVADTGSDLTWAQCQPCKNCYNQTGLPFLVPASSSTYRLQSCQSKACQSLVSSQASCDSENICHYEMSYGDKSYTIGDLATDTFWFGPIPFENVVFGCGHDNNGTFNENTSGIIGLGGGEVSLINQLSSVIRGTFSYCLISETNETSNLTSKINFGDHVNVTGSNVVSTPLINEYPPTFYYVNLVNVVVGNQTLSYNGNIIIDSGTTLTLLERGMYNTLVSSLTDAIGGGRAGDPQGLFELCYRDLDLGSVPTATFGFDGANVEVLSENLFEEIEKGVSCLTIVPSDDVAIFGNLLQRNLMIGFDLVNHKVSFKPTDCSKH